jgi:DNA-binding transcriptional LysR family regulator
VEEGLLALRQRHPGLVIELLSGNRVVDLARGEADLAVRMTAAREANVRVRRLARQRIALFASGQYVQSRGAPGDVRSLRGHDVLLPSGDLAALPEAKWLEGQAGVRVVFRTSSMPALFAATLVGAGIAPLTESWGAREPTLRKLFTIDDVPPRPLWLALGAEASSRVAVRFVADAIVDAFARVEREGLASRR